MSEDASDAQIAAMTGMVLCFGFLAIIYLLEDILEASTQGSSGKSEERPAETDGPVDR